MEKYIKDLGGALTALSENPFFKVIEEAELSNMEDLKTKATMLSITDPLYGQKTAYMNGLVEGIRRWRLHKQTVKETYKKGETNGRKQNPGASAPAYT